MCVLTKKQTIMTERMPSHATSHVPDKVHIQPSFLLHATTISLKLSLRFIKGNALFHYPFKEE